MPYIKQEDRVACTRPLSEFRPATSGELNYVFTIYAIQYIQSHGLCYQTLNDIVGAFDGAKAEFQRRVVAPYEDEKIAQNDDVYPTLEQLKNR